MKTTAAALALSLVIATNCHAAIFVVRADGLGITPDIQTAVDSSVDGDEIWLISGVFTGLRNRDIEMRDKNILIKSFDDDPSTCIIDCGGSPAEPHRAFRFADSAVQTTTLQSITIRNGYATPGGGAMLFIDGAAATINNCVFENNATGMTDFNGGGAIYVDRGGLPVFNDCVFRNNESFAGGALGTNHGGRVTFNDCRFIGNRAVRGGAIWGKTADKFGCLFYANEATDVGGAVWGIAVGIDYYENCTLDSNRAPAGGAIYVTANYGGSVELVDCIISNSLEGAAMDIHPAVPVTLSCSNLYGNAGGDWIAPFAAQVDERGNFSANPCYCDVLSEDFHLSADSYARAGGHPWGCNQLVGAYGVGCGESGCSGPVTVEGMSFGSVKSLFR